MKERGADGEVAGWGLAREVFNLSNEYDIPDFTALRERCMVAIITEFPRLGCEYFTGEVFGEGRGMGGRWDAVDALCKSAMEVRMGGVCAALVFSALPSLQFLQETHLVLRIILACFAHRSLRATSMKLAPRGYPRSRLQGGPKKSRESGALSRLLRG